MVDRQVAVDVALPFVTSDLGHEAAPKRVTDGNLNSAFADFRFALRYNLRAVMPSAPLYGR